MYAETFQRLARSASRAMGSPGAFAGALFIVLLWAVTGPLFQFSNGWQLTINTGTTIVTFLMVFLIQHSQNRDTQVTQLKLEEWIRALSAARTELVTRKALSAEERRRLQPQSERCARPRKFSSKKEIVR